MFHDLRDLSHDSAYSDTDLICQDGSVRYNRLLAGFLFPQLATSSVYHCPLQATLILPDHSINEVQELLQQKLIEFETEQVNITHLVAVRQNGDIEVPALHRLETGQLQDIPINFEMKMVEMDFAQKYQDNNRRFDEFQPQLANFYPPPGVIQEIVNNSVDPITISSVEKLGTLEKKLRTKKQGKKFNMKIALNGEKCFMCFYCDYTSSDHSHVKRHERTHTGERPYSCTTCGQKFGQISSKMRHERTHTGEKPFKCRFCGKSFSRQHGQLGHERMHTGERPYFCNYCHEKFTTPRDKKRHEKKMHSENKQFVMKLEPI